VKGERNVEPNSSVKRRRPALDRAIAELAERQYGVISRAQLLALGLERWAIWHRLQIGRLHPIHRGVYAVGHRVLAREGRWMSAVLAVGEDAVLSHNAAAAHLGIRYPADPGIEVTSPRRVRAPSGVSVHWRVLPPDEVTMLRAIPVTTVPRTLLDLATVLDKRQVERAIEEADRRRLDDPLSLIDLVERYPGRRGTGVIKGILDESRIGSTFTRSELEEHFLAFLKTHSLPSPELNLAIEMRGSSIEADCVWRRQRVIVELDGHASHATAAAYERDRARDRALHAAGWRVVRITWRQLHRDGNRVAADLRSLLG
jgi:very-short-patch-repair endonuclease